MANLKDPQFWLELLKSKRTWIIIGIIAANASGLLPHEVIDKLGLLAVLGTKVIDAVGDMK